MDELFVTLSKLGPRNDFVKALHHRMARTLARYLGVDGARYGWKSLDSVAVCTLPRLVGKTTALKRFAVAALLCVPNILVVVSREWRLEELLTMMRAFKSFEAWRPADGKYRLEFGDTRRLQYEIEPSDHLVLVVSDETAYDFDFVQLIHLAPERMAMVGLTSLYTTNTEGYAHVAKQCPMFDDYDGTDFWSSPPARLLPRYYPHVSEVNELAHLFTTVS